MGRKNTSNKQNLNLSVDKNLVKLLKKHGLNASFIFTNAAKKELKKYDDNGNVDADRQD